MHPRGMGYSCANALPVIRPARFRTARTVGCTIAIAWAD